jgi:hypothetical protein
MPKCWSEAGFCISAGDADAVVSRKSYVYWATLIAFVLKVSFFSVGADANALHSQQMISKKGANHEMKLTNDI